MVKFKGQWKSYLHRIMVIPYILCYLKFKLEFYVIVLDMPAVIFGYVKS